MSRMRRSRSPACARVLFEASSMSDMCAAGLLSDPAATVSGTTAGRGKRRFLVHRKRLDHGLVGA